ncbi:uncharacterized protein LOC128214699 [Mya arenaria]|uniref:uncharacterized protein LOC128214699 n=1 Tax=Mya arenaria TaxID=6604 RepID=UPI0022E6E555|nr:uncharacterized protein LOC128214699 [Mya arenaria]
MVSNKEVGDPCQFDKLSVRELKINLRDRGAHVSGNRPELIKPARGLVQIRKRTLKEINIQDNNNKLEQQEELFTTPLAEKLPEPGSLKGCWEDDVLKIPFFRTQDLYNYLVLNRSRTFDNQNMNARKQLKAKVFYEDGHVHSVKYNQISHKCSHYYVRAKVIPSLPGSDVKKKDYEPWACLSKVSGKVHAAGCNCAAWEGESCNHVAALLYALVDIGSKQKDVLRKIIDILEEAPVVEDFTMDMKQTVGGGGGAGSTPGPARRRGGWAKQMGCLPRYKHRDPGPVGPA